MDKRVENLIRDWQKKNILGFYCANKEEAVKELITFIPESCSVGISGSQTIEETGIVKELESRGNRVFNQNKKGLSREESLRLRELGACADYYLTSANAIALNGELVFFSANGQRIAGISSAKNVIVVCGINKITPDLDQAIKRAREYVTPLNCKRLNWNTPCFKDGLCSKATCLFPEYKRMCCQILIIEAEVAPGRLKVILTGENLGF